MSPPSEAAPLVRVRELVHRFGSGSALEVDALDISAGECLAILGPNGSGKTTLLRSILGLLRPSRGTIELGGTPVSSLSAGERAARVAWLPQTPNYHEALRVIDCVAAARFRFDEARAHSQRVASAALAQMGLEAFAERGIDELSGGEQQRVGLASVLAQGAPLVLLDEPANHLDPARQSELYTQLGSLLDDGTAIACVTHDVNLLRFLRRKTPERHVRLIGLRAGRVAVRTHLDDPDLASALRELFGMHWERTRAEPGPAFIASPEAPA